MLRNCDVCNEPQGDDEATRHVHVRRFGIVVPVAAMGGPGCPPPGACGPVGPHGWAQHVPTAAAIVIPTTPAGADSFREVLQHLPDGLKALIYRDLYREGMRIDSAERSAKAYLKSLAKKDETP